MDQPSFEQKPIESDIQAIATEVNRAQEARTENRAEGVEAVKNAIRAFPRLNANEHSAAGTVSATPAPAVNANIANVSSLPAYAETASPETKREIEHLLDVAMEHGVSKALTESEKSPYFVRDAFHDALAGRLYAVLERRGLIK